MKYVYFALIPISLPLLADRPFSAHMYDAIGVKA
tara:strand:+ start:319 stop:420 length:102 start_codon:yes stop_codon:yes gene_type:complete